MLISYVDHLLYLSYTQLHYHHDFLNFTDWCRHWIDSQSLLIYYLEYLLFFHLTFWGGRSGFPHITIHIHPSPISASWNALSFYSILSIDFLIVFAKSITKPIIASFFCNWSMSSCSTFSAWFHSLLMG